MSTCTGNIISNLCWIRNRKCTHTTLVGWNKIILCQLSRSIAILWYTHSIILTTICVNCHLEVLHTHLCKQSNIIACNKRFWYHLTCKMIRIRTRNICIPSLTGIIIASFQTCQSKFCIIIELLRNLVSSFYLGQFKFVTDNCTTVIRMIVLCFHYCCLLCLDVLLLLLNRFIRSYIGLRIFNVFIFRKYWFFILNRILYNTVFCNFCTIL